MTHRQIKKELDKIYKERRSWNGGKGPFDKLSINRRTLILIKQQILYRLENSKIVGNQKKEFFLL